VLHRGAVLALAGVAIGVAGAAAVTRLLGGFLFEVTPLDPATFASGVVALVAVAMLACWLPAWRATRLDPVRALRAD
jgi:putative ABC transport system permease protein